VGTGSVVAGTVVAGVVVAGELVAGAEVGVVDDDTTGLVVTTVGGTSLVVVVGFAVELLDELAVLTGTVATGGVVVVDVGAPSAAIESGGESPPAATSWDEPPLPPSAGITMNSSNRAATAAPITKRCRLVWRRDRS